MKRIESHEDLKAVKEGAKAAWNELIYGDQPLVCIGRASCGVSAKACVTQKSIQDELVDRGEKPTVMKAGCLGFCYAEPLVYLKSPEGPLICYKRVTPEAGPDLVDRVFFKGDLCPDQALGTMAGESKEVPPIWSHPMLKPQVRIALRNCGIIDPGAIDHYIARGGYQALAKALSSTPEEMIEEVKKSGLRGRGGAGFPTGLKWEFCRRSQGEEKYLICNADEGDPGAFMDRAILEGDPHAVLEGMLIAAWALGATRGYIYCRAEYPLALERIDVALAQARDMGLLGRNVLGTGFDFDIDVKEGAGAFVCGEETALMASIEGRRGMPRARPPYPANAGLWNMPTNINNVETLADLGPIIENGGKWYSSFGTEKSKGTKTLALAGAVRRTGLVEIPMGMTLKKVVFDIGGGMSGESPCKGVLTGGPSGGCIPASLLDVTVDYESLTAAGSIVGSGSMIVIDEGTCIVDLARFFLSFTQRESCGKCTPCRIGTKMMLDILEGTTRGETSIEDLDRLERLAGIVKDGSLCGLGSTAPNPVLTTLRYFRDEYEEHIANLSCRALVCNNLVTFKIDPDLCTGCRICAKNCPAEAISGESKKPHEIDQERCIRCSLCLALCPEKFGAVFKSPGRGSRGERIPALVARI